MRILAVVAVVASVAAGSTAAKPPPALEGVSVAGVPFGVREPEAVAKLSALLGRPSRRFANSGCGPRYTEVAWRHLYVEFRSGRLSGFRYIERGWPPSRFGTRPVASDRPRLATSRGVTLGSTLHELRAAYGRLAVAGAGRWRSGDGLVFYDDAASRIVEIKAGTCGDF